MCAKNNLRQADMHMVKMTAVQSYSEIRSPFCNFSYINKNCP